MWPIPYSVMFGNPVQGFAGGTVSAGSIQLAAQLMLTSNNMPVPLAGGPLTINGVALGQYDYVVKQGNQTIAAFVAGDWFTGTADTRSAFIVVNGNLIVNVGQTVIPAVRKLFTVVYVAGTLTLNGEISMTWRGANHAATPAGAIRIATGTFGGVVNPQIPAAGGAAGAENGIAGAAGTAGGTGGGGGGGRSSSAGGTPGAAGTCFSGGPGGGGGRSGTGTNVAGSAGGPNGGVGGTGAGFTPGGSTRGGGGGAGNPGGLGGAATNPGSPGLDGTGGVLIVIATGALSGSGSCIAYGYNGGEGGNPVGALPGGGGGSGGGAVTVIAPSGILTVAANGGLGATLSDNDGGNGGAGTARNLIG
jgi:hypothetical protein